MVVTSVEVEDEKHERVKDSNESFRGLLEEKIDEEFAPELSLRTQEKAEEDAKQLLGEAIDALQDAGRSNLAEEVEELFAGLD